jgi:hypothetical protein
MAPMIDPANDRFWPLPLRPLIASERQLLKVLRTNIWF